MGKDGKKLSSFFVNKEKLPDREKFLPYITFNDILWLVIYKRGEDMREQVSGGALTETTLLVLLSLYTELHGYGIKLLIEEKTEGRVVLGMGTLYGAIKNLVNKGWIVESSREEGKVNYQITDLGREQVVQEERRLAQLQSLIQEIRRE